jgi:hypothetical protein
MVSNELEGILKEVVEAKLEAYPDTCVEEHGEITTNLRFEVSIVTLSVGLRVQPQALDRVGWSTVCAMMRRGGLLLPAALL